MARTVQAFLPLAGPPDALERAFTGDPHRWLPQVRRDGARGWNITLYAGSFSRTVLAELGSPWRSGKTVWRTLCWDPVAEDSTTVDRLLPSFDGEIGLTNAGETATLVLDGRYSPPGGAVGAALDTVALHRVATSTVDRLLADISARLCSEAVLEAPSADRHLPRDARATSCGS